MLFNCDKDSSSSLSIGRKSDDFNTKLRIYVSEQNYIDFPIHQFSMDDTYFIKDKQIFKQIKELQSDDFFSFIKDFTDGEYLNFIQEKNYVDFSVDLDKSFPSELVIPDFRRDSYMDSLSQTDLDVSSKSFLDYSVFDTKKTLAGFQVETDCSDNNNCSKKNSNTDEESEIITKSDFCKKEECNVIQIKKSDKKQERKKANRRKKKEGEHNEFKRLKIGDNFLEIFPKFSKDLITSKKSSEFHKIEGLFPEKVIKSEIDPNTLSTHYYFMDLKTDFRLHILREDTDYKKPILKIIGEIEEKIDGIYNGDAAKDFVMMAMENMSVFYCQKNEEGKLQGLGKYMYKDSIFSYCKTGYFVNGSLNGLGAQVPIGTSDKKKIKESTSRWYKVGIWDNNDLVQGFQWELKEDSKYARVKSIFTIGEIKKDKAHGQAARFTTINNNDQGNFSNISLKEIIKNLRIKTARCGHFIEDSLCGEGKIIKFRPKFSKEKFVDSMHTLCMNHSIPFNDEKKLLEDDNIYKCATDVNTSIYVGGLLDGKYDGQGKIIYHDGGVYEGGWKMGKKNGHGVLVNNNGKRYEGEYNNDKQEGKGKLVTENGEVFEGQWVNSKLHGKGRVQWSDGREYIGEWVHDERHGYGVHKESNGRRYEGMWANDKQNGFGKLISEYNDVYEGIWMNSKLHGKAKITHTDGRIQEGTWEHGFMHGYGMYSDTTGRRYEGMWYCGATQGFGKMNYQNGDTFEGGWHYDKKEGPGKFTWADGSVYQGDWHVNKMHGYGVYSKTNGDCYKGHFQQGVRHGEGSEYIAEKNYTRKAYWKNDIPINITEYD